MRPFTGGGESGRNEAREEESGGGRGATEERGARSALRLNTRQNCKAFCSFSSYRASREAAEILAVLFCTYILSRKRREGEGEG